MTDPRLPIQVTVFAKTDLGRTRDHNEDTFLVADLSTGESTLDSRMLRHTVGDRGLVLLVADGMGGAAAGELASAMAADLIWGHMKEVWSSEGEVTVDRFTYRLREAVELANLNIHRYAKEHPEVRGMGTTATVAGVFGGRLYLAQVGDSRAYLVRNGDAVQLTKDQSLTQRLVDAGELTEEEAEASERRNIILQALGPDPQIKVELTHQKIRHGDTLLLCSDGLSGQMRKEEIAAVASVEQELPEIADELIDLANTRGGPDNITVVVARFSGANPTEGDTAADEEGDDAAYRVYQSEEDEEEADAAEEELLEEEDDRPPPPILPVMEGLPEPIRRAGPNLVVGVAIALLVVMLAVMFMVLL